jgi:hypothetical protein
VGMVGMIVLVWCGVVVYKFASVFFLSRNNIMVFLYWYEVRVTGGMSCLQNSHIPEEFSPKLHSEVSKIAHLAKR